MSEKPKYRERKNERRKNAETQVTDDATKQAQKESM